MSGPVTTDDSPTLPESERPDRQPRLEITPSRAADVGGAPVRRALPRRTRRTVGAWCFVDHMGPLAVTKQAGMEVGPHPHLGLQTVTWLVAGELLHRDSMGSEQLIRPGQLNLMTAGNGVSHAEESTGEYEGDMHGVQLWVAQPEETRHGPAAFEHHAELPQFELGAATGTVLVGTLAGAASSARRDTDHLGVDLQMQRGSALVPLERRHEYAVIVLQGAVEVAADGPAGSSQIVPGQLAYLGMGRDELQLTATQDARLLLLGGQPFESTILMYWNFVARTREEMDIAYADWNQPTDSNPRFGDPGGPLKRIPAPATPWAR